MTRRLNDLPEAEAALIGITPEMQSEAEKEEKVAREKLEVRKKFLMHLMQAPDFRMWLMEKLNAFGAFDNPFGNSPTGFPDALATQFKLGMKAAGWALWEEFDNLTPDLASRMRREFAGLA